MRSGSAEVTPHDDPRQTGHLWHAYCTNICISVVSSCAAQSAAAMFVLVRSVQGVRSNNMCRAWYLADNQHKPMPPLFLEPPYASIIVHCCLGVAL